MLKVLGAAAAAVAIHGAAVAQERPSVRVTVVTLDEVRQGQVAYVQGLIDGLGGRWGGFWLTRSDTGPYAFRSCRDDRAEYAERCVRFGVQAGGMKHDHQGVVLIVDDAPPQRPDRRGGEARVVCVGVGEAATDVRAQAVDLWPDAARVHGSNDLERDRAALTACVKAALAEAPRPAA